MREMRRRLLDKGFRKASSYRPMANHQKVKLGLAFIEICRQVTGLFEWQTEYVTSRKQACRLYFTDKYWDFIDRWGDALRLMRPHMTPLVIPPKAHDMDNQGGYHLIQTKYCRTYEHEEMQASMDEVSPDVFNSINYLQSIPFKWNHGIMKLQWDLWQRGHAVGHLPKRDRMARPVNAAYKDKEKGGTKYWSDMYLWRQDMNNNVHRTRFMRSQAIYDRLKTEPKLFFAWSADFRGRKSVRGASVNFQGNDVYRSQLQFHEGSVLQPHLKEVMWALGDAAGIAKCHMTREVFYRENLPFILQTGIDPLGRTAFWEGRKDPWRFLALVTDIYKAHQDPAFITHLPFQLDQTNSGYGHLAALTRDEDLARRTNLIGKEYNDLYEDIRQEVLALVHADAHDPFHKQANWWQQNGSVAIERPLIKEAVMPVIYNRSHLTLLASIRSHIEEAYVNFNIPSHDGGPDLKSLELAAYLAAKVNKAVEKIIPSVGRLDKWLRQYSDTFPDNRLAGFFSPNDLWITTGKKSFEYQRCHLTVSGRTVTFKAREEVGIKDEKASRNGLSAHYIHALDAAFLERFVNHWARCYQKPMVTIHDCFGTTLENVALMREELRDQFSRFHSDDHFIRPSIYAATHNMPAARKLPPAPAVDDLLLTQIGENPFLFC
jgi:DNA-directed RNA polymerase